MADKPAHEESCEQTYQCPYNNQKCEWQGLMNEIVPHILSQHPGVKITKRWFPTS